MDNKEEKILPETGEPDEAPKKRQWQATKESWYDHLNVTVKQLDIIIGVAIGGLVIVTVLIALDALGVI